MPLEFVQMTELTCLQWFSLLRHFHC